MSTGTLYVTDLDGTLLDADSRVSADSARIISSLTDRGVAVTVATARTPATVVPLTQKCRLRLPAVVMTGAALWNFATGTYDAVHHIAAHTAARVREAFDAAGVRPFIYTLAPDAPLRVYHAGRTLTKPEQNFYDPRSSLALKRFYLNATPPQAEDACHVLYFGFGRQKEISSAVAMLRQIPGISISHYPDIFNPDLWLVEILAAGVDKAAAVLDLKRRVGADRLVVFGDNLNDIPMMQVADLAVAVANARSEVLNMADTVTGPNTDDAVAHFIAADCGGE